MADYTYAYNGPQEGTARAVLRDAPLSTKVAIELCNKLRGKATEPAKAFLGRVIKHEEAVPFKRFTNGLGHKHGMAAGRYPEKASKLFIKLIDVAEANASQQGLAADLVIAHLVAQGGSRPYHYGRQRRRQTKRVHIEIVLKEAEGAKRKRKEAKAAPTAQPPLTQPEQKPEAPTVKQELPVVKQENPVKPKTVKPRAPKTKAAPPSQENAQP